uniref:Uncharacterized protein n=1 Tax=Panagrolaimus superbus TaxID=310955 RepID=A0A914Z495_9BILA
MCVKVHRDLFIFLQAHAKCNSEDSFIATAQNRYELKLLRNVIVPLNIENDMGNIGGFWAGIKTEGRTTYSMDGTKPMFHGKLKAIKLLSNFTADSHQSLEFVIDANLIPIIIEIAKENPEISFQKECANVLCNALMCAKKEQVQYLFNEGIGDSLCSFIENPNPEIIKIIIFDLSSILEIIDEVYQEIPLQIKASLQKSKGRNGFTDPQTVELLRHFLEQF